MLTIVQQEHPLTITTNGWIAEASPATTTNGFGNYSGWSVPLLLY